MFCRGTFLATEQPPDSGMRLDSRALPARHGQDASLIIAPIALIMLRAAMR